MMLKSLLAVAATLTLASAQTTTSYSWNATATATGTTTSTATKVITTTLCYTTTVTDICEHGICSKTYTRTQHYTCRNKWDCRPPHDPYWKTKTTVCDHCGDHPQTYTITCPDEPTKTPPPHCNPHDDDCMCKWHGKCKTPPTTDCTTSTTATTTKSPHTSSTPCTSCKPPHSTPPVHPPPCKECHPDPECHNCNKTKKPDHPPPTEPVSGSARNAVGSMVAGAVLLVMVPLLL